MIVLLRMSFKKVLSNLPTILAGTLIIVMASALLVFGFFKYSANYNDRKTIVKTNIGLVNNDKSEYSMFAKEYFTTISSVKNLVELIPYDTEEEAIEALKSKNTLAYALMPEGFVDAVFNGTNIPLRIYFGDLTPNAGAGFFFDILDAATNDVGISQAGIYAMDTATSDLELDKDTTKKINSDTNDIFINAFFDREDMYKNEFQSSTVGLKLAEFYGCTFIVLLITLSGLSFVSILKQNTSTLLSTMKRNGIPLFISLYNSLSCSLIFTVLVAVAWFIASHRLLFLPSLFLAIFSLISFNSLIYRFFKDETTSMLTISIVSFILLFLAGGIFSISFMSNYLIDIGRYTHVGASFNLLKIIATGSNSIERNIICVIYSVLMSSLAVILDYRKATKS